jgi:hypothetical protein
MQQEENPLSELRVVHPFLTSQPLVVRSREVMLDADGVTEPLTDEEHTYLVSIPIFSCAAAIQEEPCPVCDAPPLEGTALLDAVLDTFDGEIVTPPSLADLADKVYGDTEAGGEEDFQDLFEAWQDMDADERCDTVSSLEDNGADDFLLRSLFDFEANLLNNPAVIIAIDAAIGHLQPKQTKEQINEALVRKSAENKVKTKNPPTKTKKR